MPRTNLRSRLHGSETRCPAFLPLAVDPQSATRRDRLGPSVSVRSLPLDHHQVSRLSSSSANPARACKAAGFFLGCATVPRRGAAAAYGKPPSSAPPVGCHGSGHTDTCAAGCSQEARAEMRPRPRYRLLSRIRSRDRPNRLIIIGLASQRYTLAGPQGRRRATETGCALHVDLGRDRDA